MKSGAHNSIVLRLWATITFLCYLAAGASFALPSMSRCGRCVKQTHLGAVKAGSSCLLSHKTKGQSCHKQQTTATGQIKLCPDGCLRHDREGGEITTIAKFLSPPESFLPNLFPIEIVSTKEVLATTGPTITPPYHPPSFS